MKMKTFHTVTTSIAHKIVINKQIITKKNKNMVVPCCSSTLVPQNRHQEEFVFFMLVTFREQGLRTRRRLRNDDHYLHYCN